MFDADGVTITRMGQSIVTMATKEPIEVAAEDLWPILEHRATPGNDEV